MPNRSGSRGAAGRPGARFAQAALSAALATLPAILGALLGEVLTGFTASFGAYLVTVTHPALPAQGGARRLALTIVMLSLGATAGAASGMRIWTVVPLAVACAAWQAWTEIADTELRLPAAMSVLALLLSCGNVGTDISAAGYSTAFAAGAAWQGAVQFVSARTGDAPPVPLVTDFRALRSSRVKARRFAAVMAALGLVGGTTAMWLPVPHAVWLLTAALRVMKPLRESTWRRLQQRFVGTAMGALVAAGLLAFRLPALLHGAVLAGTLTAMQMVGARRYAPWTFCLTVIALDLGVLPQDTGWVSAGCRLLLTAGGLALAFLFSLCLP
jgi:hypothetical protein